MVVERQSKTESAGLVHVHSFYSLLGNVAASSSPAEIASAAKSLGYGAIALTDRANVYGLGKFFHSCRQEGLRAGIGVELPLHLDWTRRVVYPTILARNNEGLKQLFQLITRVKGAGKALTPEDLSNADLNVLLRGEDPHLAELLSEDHFFYALDAPHPITSIDMVRIARATGKLIAAHEVRFLETDSQALVNFLQRIWGKNDSQHKLQPFTNLTSLYSHYPEALGLANELTEEWNVSLPEPPKVKAKSVPAGQSSFAYLQKRVWQEARKRPDFSALKERLVSELAIIRTANFADIILICSEIIDYCKRSDIAFLVTGSGNDSAVLASLGMLSIDPEGLLSERFLNPQQTKKPDIDITIEYSRLEEVVNFVLASYDEATLLSVVKTLKRYGLKNLAQRHGVQIAPNEVVTLEDAHLPFVVAKHPTGVIFLANAPQVKVAQRNLAQLDTHDAEDLWGLDKIDLISSVGLERLSRIAELLARGGIVVKIPRDDPKALARLYSGENIGITAFESPFIAELLREIKRSFPQAGSDYLPIALSLARPAAGVRELFFQKDHAAKRILSKYPEIATIFAPTNYLALHQEQILRTVTEIAGLPWSVANKARKMMSEKVTSEEKEQLTTTIHEALAQKGYQAEVQKTLLQLVRNFVDYGFVEGHARALATLYDLAFYAAHYPAYFHAAVLSTAVEKESSRLYPLVAYVNDALRHVHFDFPPVDKLPHNTSVVNGQLVPGSTLMTKSRPFPQYYSQFLRMFEDKRVSLSDLVKFQLAHFGVSLTDNPVCLLPQALLFDPVRERQDIAGVPIYARELTIHGFVSLDSGTVVHLHMPQALKERKKDLLGGYFWHLRIAGDPKTGRYEVIDILPPISQLTL